MRRIMPERRAGHGRRVLAAACALSLVGGAAAWWLLRGPGGTRVTAEFDEAVGVYAGSDVRVLGVKVGTVDSVTPHGTHVTVRMTIDSDVAIPADAQALVVSPAVVSDRFVQLTPTYSCGPRLADGAVIPTSRTATPVELDQLYASLTELATALGPNGANAKGALSDLLNTGAANLGGNGRALADVIRQLGEATRTLSGSEGDLFGTVDNLQQFTTMLKDNDGQVRQVEQQLASVSDFLAQDRQDLAAALDQLATALAQVKDFIQSNRGRIKSNVDKLAEITQILVKQQASLTEALDTIPLTVTNLVNAYDPVNHVLVSRSDLNELSLGVENPFGVPPPTGRPPEPPTRRTGAQRAAAQPEPLFPLPAVGDVYSTPAPAGTR
jgi:phospholipid/cholesterol/gamma-HCH transport system substrate-binding protein